MHNYMKTILLLGFSCFCMGVAEFIISGILTPLSLHFRVSPADVGYLATVYAIGVVIGAPILSVVIAKFDYKFQLSMTMLIFCLSNAVVFVSDNFLISLVARFICGLMHGLFFVIATIVAIKISPQAKTSQAISIMMSGLTIALVSGVPLGMYLSENYGLLSPFLFIATCSLMVSIGAIIIMPRIPGKKATFKNLLVAFNYPTLYQGFLITAFTCGAQFVLYIYLRLFLGNLEFSLSEMGSLFLMYGIAAIIGNLFGGRLTDKKGSFNALRIVLIGQFIFFTLMSCTFYINNAVMIINLFIMSFFGFASISPLKMLSSFLAKKYTPDTQNDTIALNEGSFNIGIALASVVGGIVASLNVNLNGIFGGLFSLSALLILVFLVKKGYR